MEKVRTATTTSLASMVTKVKCTGPLESGTYIIRSVLSSSPLNLVCKKVGADPVVCIWNTVKSPTEQWCVELGEQGYFIRNAATSHYINFEPPQPPKVEETPVLAEPSISGTSKTAVPVKVETAKKFTKLKIIGSQQPVSWNIDEVGSSYHIKLSSDPELVLDVEGFGVRDGAHLIACNDLHGKENQQWSFERVDDVQPPSYSRRCYIGSVPAGFYCIGATEGTPKLTDKKSAALRFTSSHRLALGVAARLPLKDDENADVSLGILGNGPWPNQMWALESGRRGYRLKNLGIDAYLSYVDSGLVLESMDDGPLSATEWVPLQGAEKVPFDAYLRPSSDLSMVLGVSQSDQFGILHIRSSKAWAEELKKGYIFNQWRFDSFPEKFLDILSHLN